MAVSECNWMPALSLSDFDIHEQLGAGRFGTVYQATFKLNGKQLALKIIPKSKIISPTLHKQLERQIQIQSRLKHPAICELYCYFYDINNVYIVLEECPKGSLFRAFKLQNSKPSNKRIAHIIYQLLSGLVYLERRHVIHRDLKLENILLDKDYNVKISDFGWCVHSMKQRSTFCGTMEYICPEMIFEEHYGSSVDVYCAGIIMFELYCGRSPFFADSEQQIRANIRRGIIDYGDNVVPDDARRVIQMMLRKNSNERPTAQAILKDSYFDERMSQPARNSNQLTNVFMPSLSKDSRVRSDATVTSSSNNMLLPFCLTAQSSPESRKLQGQNAINGPNTIERNNKFFEAFKARRRRRMTTSSEFNFSVDAQSTQSNVSNDIKSQLYLGDSIGFRKGFRSRSMF